MTKKLVSIRVSEETDRKLRELAERHGTMTEAVAVAVDRLHREETDMFMLTTLDESERIYWDGQGWYGPVQKGQPFQHVEWHKTSPGLERQHGLGTAEYMGFPPFRFRLQTAR